MTKKSDSKTIKNFIVDEGVKIWYHNAPQYWIHAHTEENVPIVEYYEMYDVKERKLVNLKNKKITDQYKYVTLEESNKTIINGLLNSHLFYWWYIIWSDGRHLLNQHILTFPINLNFIAEHTKENLKPLVDDLMNSYNENANERINVRSGGYAIKIKEIIPKISINIIDQIDEILATHYGFTDDEKRFIKNFDLKFRL
jgi:hypothetical protein